MSFRAPLVRSSSRPVAPAVAGRMRALLVAGAVTALGVSLGACTAPASDTLPAAQAGERFAHALLRAPTRKPCRGDACLIRSATRLAGARDTTYVAALVGTDSVLRRWPVRVGKPVLVWVDPGRRGSEADRQRVARVRQAFRTWETMGVPVRFRFLRDSMKSEVRVRWVDTLPGPRAGFIRWTSDEQGWLTGADVALARRNSQRQYYPLQVLQAVVTHEVGHLLGLEHSPDSLDVMAAQVQARRPTGRDTATVRLLYSGPAGRVR